MILDFKSYEHRFLNLPNTFMKLNNYIIYIQVKNKVQNIYDRKWKWYLSQIEIVQTYHPLSVINLRCNIIHIIYFSLIAVREDSKIKTKVNDENYTTRHMKSRSRLSFTYILTYMKRCFVDYKYPHDNKLSG